MIIYTARHVTAALQTRVDVINRSINSSINGNFPLAHPCTELIEQDLPAAVGVDFVEFFRGVLDAHVETNMIHTAQKLAEVNSAIKIHRDESAMIK